MPVGPETRRFHRFDRGAGEERNRRFARRQTERLEEPIGGRAGFFRRLAVDPDVSHFEPEQEFDGALGVRGDSGPIARGDRRARRDEATADRKNRAATGISVDFGPVDRAGRDETNGRERFGERFDRVQAARDRRREEVENGQAERNAEFDFARRRRARNDRDVFADAVFDERRIQARRNDEIDARRGRRVDVFRRRDASAENAFRKRRANRRRRFDRRDASADPAFVQRFSRFDRLRRVRDVDRRQQPDFPQFFQRVRHFLILPF